MCLQQSMRKKLIEVQGKTGKSSIKSWLSTPLPVTDSSRKQEIRKYIAELHSTINQLHRIDIYIILHPTTAEKTFFSHSHGTFTKTDCILNCKEHSQI